MDWVDPKSKDWCPYKRRERSQRRWRVKTEIGAMCLKAVGRDLERGLEQFFPRASGRNLPRQNLHFGL